jgi:hypothetical protein
MAGVKKLDRSKVLALWRFSGGAATTGHPSRPCSTQWASIGQPLRHFWQQETLVHRSARSLRGKGGQAVDRGTRKLYATRNGHVGNTVVFSILDHEWPALRARLEPPLSTSRPLSASRFKYFTVLANGSTKLSCARTVVGPPNVVGSDRSRPRRCRIIHFVELAFAPQVDELIPRVSAASASVGASASTLIMWQRSTSSRLRRGASMMVSN